VHNALARIAFDRLSVSLLLRIVGGRTLSQLA
jgi:hypothetical protein